jgi:cell wall assembly regulator SMI1
VQKFTRPLTREIELAGERLALTLSDQGVAVRPVGSRRPPWELTWGALLCHVTGRQLPAGQAPAEADLAAAVGTLKKADAPRPAAAPMPAADKATAATGAAVTDTESPLSRLEKWLGKHRPRYLQSLAPPAGPQDFQTLEEAGIPVPSDLRTLLAWHNGQGTEFGGHFAQDWDLMSASRIAEARRDLEAGGDAAPGWQKAWIPFLDDDAGDYVCLDPSQPGTPVREFWQGQAEHPVVAPSLAAWLTDFVAAVERGEYHEDPERGTFMRRGSQS